MGYAYNCLTEKEKTNIKTIAIEYLENVIEIKLRTLQNWRRFTYTPIFEGFTSVVDVSKKQEIKEINESFVDVAGEDVNLLVVNQKCVLKYFAAGPRIPIGTVSVAYDESVIDPIISKIFEILNNSLASRTSPLQVLWASFSPTKVSEGMNIVRHLDPWILFKTFFSFKFRNETVNLEELRHDWNEGDLDVTVNKLTKENLEELRMFPTTRRFSTLPGDQAIFDFLQLAADFFNILDPSISDESLGLKVLANSVVMEKVLVELQFFDLQNLRKVSKGVRDCIDAVKPEPHIKAYSLRLTGRWVYARIDLKNEDYRRINSLDREIALYDFHINLMHQKTHLEELKIAFENTLEPDTEFAIQLGEVLRRRKKALKVETLSFGSETQADMMQVLPYLDKDSLKKINILNISYWQQNMTITYFTHLFDVDEVARTEQWKSASQLSSEQSTVTTTIPKMNITHFTNVDIQVETISSEDVDYLRTELLKSATLEKFKIKFKTSTIDERLHTLFGEPFRITPNFKKIWFFRMPGTKYYLHMALDTHDRKDEFRQPELKLLSFAKVAKENTPF